MAISPTPDVGDHKASAAAVAEHRGMLIGAVEHGGAVTILEIVECHRWIMPHFCAGHARGFVPVHDVWS